MINELCTTSLLSANRAWHFAHRQHCTYTLARGSLQRTFFPGPFGRCRRLLFGVVFKMFCELVDWHLQS